MGVGEHFYLFHHHHQHNNNHHEHDQHKMNIPKGRVAVIVGHEDEEQKKFVIPVMFLNHPLFMELLKEAEKEFGFRHSGPINIPCHVQEFRNVQGMIDKDRHHHHICCFKD
ncbi:small auxin-up RNA [Artemisia annua]|uniref:Small auxin-up RNA n=2 Tax=Artemisia annua TaxID=35608 RepID=A0A2U1KS12_ARTAN|nr:small auxin-up RNA [Artemisia annua]